MRIRIQDSGKVCRFELEGRSEGPWVDGASNVWGALPYLGRKLDCSSNFARGIAWILLLLCSRIQLNGAELKPKTVRAFNQYVQKAELRMNQGLRLGGPFLWIDSLPSADRAAAYARLRNGEILVHPFASGLGIPGGMIHDWVGVAFIPKATLEETVAQIQNYNDYARIYSPEVARSKTLEHHGSDFKVSLWLQNKSIVTVVLGVEENVQYFRLDSSHEFSCAHSTRIVQNPSALAERQNPSMVERGYIWRINGYGWFLETPAGVYMQFEAIALSRNIPWGLGWLIRPIVIKVPRDSLLFTLAHARASLESAARQPIEVDSANRSRPSKRKRSEYNFGFSSDREVKP